MPIQLLKLTFVLLSFVLPVWILSRFLMTAYRKRNAKKVALKKELFLVVFIIYVSIVLAATIVPAPFLDFNNPKETGLNIIPVINTYKNLVYALSEPGGIQSGFALENIIGNIILFVPLGIFLPFLFVKINSIKKVAVLCFLCSLLIETTQYILRQFHSYRMADIDDIILNTLGGVLGWIIFSKLITPHISKANHPFYE